jgi:hypothetical protein
MTGAKEVVDDPRSLRQESPAVDDAAGDGVGSSPAPSRLHDLRESVADIATLRRACLAFDSTTRTDVALRALERVVIRLSGRDEPI